MQVQDIQIKTHAIAIKYTTDNAQDIVDYIKNVRYDAAVIRGDRLFVALSKNDFWDDIYDPGDNIVIMDGEYWKYSDEELAQATA